MPRDKIMAWCYIALMSLAIAGVLAYKWTRPPCHTEFSRGGPFCEEMFPIKYPPTTAQRHQAMMRGTGTSQRDHARLGSGTLAAKKSPAEAGLRGVSTEGMSRKTGRA